MCSRDNEPGVSTLPLYELQCQAAEKKLIFATLDLKTIDHEFTELEYKSNTFGVTEVALFYEKYGVSHELFFNNDSVWKYFLSELADDNSNREYVIVSALPFVKGSISEKKEMLWTVLEPKNNTIYCSQLRKIIRMMIVLCVKTIPEIVMMNFTKFGQKPDEKIKLFIESSEVLIKNYAMRYYPEEARKTISEADTQTNSNGERKSWIKQKTVLHRHEFDLWLAQISSVDLFNPQHHREQFLKILLGKRHMIN